LEAPECLLSRQYSAEKTPQPAASKMISPSWQIGRHEA